MVVHQSSVEYISKTIYLTDLLFCSKMSRLRKATLDPPSPLVLEEYWVQRVRIDACGNCAWCSPGTGLTMMRIDTALVATSTLIDVLVPNDLYLEVADCLTRTSITADPDGAAIKSWGCQFEAKLAAWISELLCGVGGFFHAWSALYAALDGWSVERTREIPSQHAWHIGIIRTAWRL